MTKPVQVVGRKARPTCAQLGALGALLADRALQLKSTPSSRVERLALKTLLSTLDTVTAFPQRLHHKTPGWVKDGSLFHVRIRAASGQTIPLTAPELSSKLLAAASGYHESGRWWCELILLMPDHVHAILAFPRVPGMTVVVRNWKRGAARLQSVHWQDNFFDHRLRDLRAAHEKWLYIRRNPVVKNLCAAEEEWPHWWSGSSDGTL